MCASDDAATTADLAITTGNEARVMMACLACGVQAPLSAWIEAERHVSNLGVRPYAVSRFRPPQRAGVCCGVQHVSSRLIAAGSFELAVRAQLVALDECSGAAIADDDVMTFAVAPVRRSIPSVSLHHASCAIDAG